VDTVRTEIVVYEPGCYDTIVATLSPDRLIQLPRIGELIHTSSLHTFGDCQDGDLSVGHLRVCGICHMYMRDERNSEIVHTIAVYTKEAREHTNALYGLE